MVDRKVFLAGMKALSVLPGRELSEALIAVYFDVLGARFDDVSWTAAVKRALETETFFPAPAFFFALSNAADDGALHVEAAQAFDAIVRSATYNPNTGTKVRDRVVAERFGEVVVQAFRAAGGAPAFNGEDERNLAFTRKEFLDVYTRLARARREAQSLPEPRRPIGDGQAGGIVAKVLARLKPVKATP